tara:strand:- start:486 stop:1295 length:810 start_codon:yes stop_codon:yes gene_type:complete
MKSSIPNDLDEEDVINFFDKALEKHSAQLIDEISQFIEMERDPRIGGLNIEVFPDEYGDGVVSIGAYYHLKRTSDFKPTYSDDPKERYFAEYVNDFPMSDTYHYADRDISLPDLSTACIVQWFKSCWHKAKADSFIIPTIICGHEDFGGERYDLTPQLEKMTRRSKIKFGGKVNLIGYDFDPAGERLQWIVYSSIRPVIDVEALHTTAASELLELIRSQSSNKKLGTIEGELADVYEWNNEHGSWCVSVLVTKVKRRTSYFSLIRCGVA